MNRTIRVIGAPTDYGANRRGVDMGPSAIRYAGLSDAIASAGETCDDCGDIPAPLVEAAPEETPEEAIPDAINARHLPSVRDVTRRLREEVAAPIADGELPVVLGGDHSVAIGSIGGSARNHEIGVIWFDAHGDFNTPETTPSGNVHGMALAGVLGRGYFGTVDWAEATGVREENVVLLGLRDVDERERVAIRESDVTAFTMSDLDARGLNDVMDEALDVASAGVDGIHVSLDLDWLDPHEAPGVGTPVRGGVSYREAHAALETVAEHDDRYDVLRSIDLVEVNPVLDERNRTAAMAAELLASGLGKRIL
ncbi:MAG: arginase [Halodesulfurarchaeum sp.]